MPPLAHELLASLEENIMTEERFGLACQRGFGRTVGYPRSLGASWAGFTPEEIAGEQGISVTAMRLRLMRARRDIRSCIEMRGFELRNMAGNQESAAAA